MLKMVLNVLPLALITIALFWANIRTGGVSSIVVGLKEGWKSFLSLASALVFMFLAVGQAQVLIARYSEAIRTYMAGGKGIFGSFLAGIVSPGNISALPIVKDMWEDGYSKKCLLVFLITSTLINFQITMWRAPIVGWKIMAIQYGITLVIALIFLLVVWIIP